MKGGINLASALQLSILSAISFATFGGPTFAAAFGVGFLLSLDDTVCAFRRWVDPGYLDKDNKARDEKLNKMIFELDNEIEELDIPPMNQKWMIKKTLQSKRDRLEELKEERFQIEDEKHIMTNDYSYQLQSKLYKTAVEAPGNVAQSYTLGKNNLVKANETMKNKLKWNFAKAIANNIHWGLAFGGMLLVCIPGLQSVGAILIIAASVLYFSKHTVTLGKKAYDAYHTEEPKKPGLGSSGIL